jgi:hypothetical protein
MEDDANSIGHYIFDETYSEEDGNVFIGSERSGSETELENSDFSTDLDGWTSGAHIATAGQTIGGRSNAVYMEGATVLRLFKDFGGTNGRFQRYKLSYYVPSDSDVNRIRIYDYSFTATFKDIIPTKGEWVDVEVIGTIANGGGAYFYVNSTAGAGGLYLKDIEFLELPANSLTPSGFSDGFGDEYADGGTILDDRAYPLMATGYSNWVTYGTNTKALDAANDIITITYQDNANGGYCSLGGLMADNPRYELGQKFYWTARVRVSKSSFTFQIYDGIAYSVSETVSPANEWVNLSGYVTISGDAQPLTRLGMASAVVGDTFEVASFTFSDVAPSNPAYQNGGVLKFNGVDQYLDGGDIHDLGTGDFTIEAWIRSPDFTSGNLLTIVHKFQDNQEAYAFYVQGTGELAFTSETGGVTQVEAISDTNPFTNGEWHHVAVVADRGTSTKLYCNGVELATTGSVFLSGDLQNTGDFVIGAFSKSLFFFNGDIAELRVSSSARSENDIFRSVNIARNWYPFLNAADAPHANVNFSQKIGRATASGVIKMGTTASDAVFSLTADALYKCELDIIDNDATSYLQVYFQGNAGYDTVISESEMANGHFSFYRTGAYIGTYLSFYGQGVGDTITLDNITVREVLNADTPTDGFVEDFSLGGAKFGTDVLTNGDFRDFTMEDDVNSIGHYIFDKSYVNEDSNNYIGSERSGSETVKVKGTVGNGDFGVAGTWSLTDATIENGVCNVNGAGLCGFTQSILTPNKKHYLQVTVTNYVTGTATLIAGEGVGANITANGT